MGGVAGGAAGGTGGGTFCTKPGIGYHAIGVDINDGTSPALYLIGKGQNDWDAEIGITTLNGAPFAPGYALSGDGSVYYAAGAGGLYTLVLPSLEWTQVGTSMFGTGVGAVSPAGMGLFAWINETGSVFCFDSNTDMNYQSGVLPTGVYGAAGIIGSCMPPTSPTDFSGSYDLKGVSHDSTSRFFFFSAHLAENTKGYTGTLVSMSDTYTGGPAIGIADGGKVAIAGSSLVQLNGTTPTVIRPLQLCVEENMDFYLNGSLPRINGFSD